jgi:hypothetical protein
VPASLICDAQNLVKSSPGGFSKTSIAPASLVVNKLYAFMRGHSVPSTGEALIEIPPELARQLIDLRDWLNAVDEVAIPRRLVAAERLYGVIADLAGLIPDRDVVLVPASVVDKAREVLRLSGNDHNEGAADVLALASLVVHELAAFWRARTRDGARREVLVGVPTGLVVRAAELCDHWDGAGTGWDDQIFKGNQMRKLALAVARGVDEVEPVGATEVAGPDHAAAVQPSGVVETVSALNALLDDLADIFDAYAKDLGGVRPTNRSSEADGWRKASELCHEIKDGRYVQQNGRLRVATGPEAVAS